MKKLSRALIFILVPLLLASLACNTASPEKIVQVVKESTEQAVGLPPTEVQPVAQEEAKTVEPSQEPAPATEVPEPTSEPIPEALPLDLSDQLGFVQNETEVTVVFFVTNPNADLAIESSDYQLTVYDQEGTVLTTENGYINLVLPEETLAFASSLYLQEGQVADRVDVQTVSGEATEMEIEGPLFTITKTEFIPDEFLSTVTGMVKNGLSRDVTDVRITAVAFNEAGEIVGGGMTWVDFIPAGSETGVEVYVNVTENPARVELYPAVSALSEFEDENPDDIVIELLDMGYGLQDQSLNVVFLVKNPSLELAVADTQYQTIVYDDQGVVLTTDSGYIDYIFPGETTAGHSTIFLPEGKKLDHIEVQINSGDPKVTDLMANPLTYDPPTFRQDDYSAKVYTTLHNAYEQYADDIETVAVAYDENGKIIGGGYSYVNFIPAGGTAAADISVIVENPPARIEIFPGIFSMSSFRSPMNLDKLALKASGFYQGDYDTKVIFEIENTDLEYAFNSSEYQVAAYDQDGTIVSTDSGYLPALLPGAKFSYASTLFLIGTVKIERVEVLLLPGETVPLSSVDPVFTIEQATFLDDPYSPKVTGIVANNLARDLQSVLVTAVLYNEAGEIIGGGYTYAELIPANGKSAVEIYVLNSGTPATVELFAAPGSTSDIQ